MIFMPLNRVRIALTGFSGLPGVATFYFGSAVTDMTAVRTFWDAVKSVFPTSVQIQVANVGDTINEDSGQIQGAWSGPAQAVVAGSGGAGSVNSMGGPMIKWVTPQVVNGRRPIGKTFLVPAVVGIYTSQGQIATGTITTLQTAAQALVTAYAGEMKTWHRPDKATGHGGVGCTITAASVSARQMVLRSRRD